MAAEEGNPYDVVGANHKMATENIKKKYVSLCWLILQSYSFTTIMMFMKNKTLSQNFILSSYADILLSCFFL